MAAVGVVVDRSVRSANRAASRWPTSAKDRPPGGQEVDVPELKLQKIGLKKWNIPKFNLYLSF